MTSEQHILARLLLIEEEMKKHRVMAIGCA
ncbi:Uncharacterised protein [Proteus mirabilis]|uniref:Uncharacterized protein n=1 Tax=Proteus mirabilis TaxID=584 RepID=A0A379GB10_PROMI|nr:Uncharacterised protein [Proteus mirabilis]